MSQVRILPPEPISPGRTPAGTDLVALSSKGRTVDLQSTNRGSTPRWATNSCAVDDFARPAISCSSAPTGRGVRSRICSVRVRIPLRAPTSRADVVQRQNAPVVWGRLGSNSPPRLQGSCSTCWYVCHSDKVESGRSIRPASTTNPGRCDAGTGTLYRALVV